MTDWSLHYTLDMCTNSPSAYKVLSHALAASLYLFLYGTTTVSLGVNLEAVGHRP